MKKVLVSVGFIFSMASAFGQYPIQQGIGSGSTKITTPNYGAFSGGLIPYTFVDTTSANTALTFLKTYNGALIYSSSDSALYFRSSGATRWTQLLPSGGINGAKSWFLNGNTIGGRSSQPVLGTIDGYDLPFVTNNIQRATISQNGIQRTALSNYKYLMIDTINGSSHYLAYGDASGGGWSLTGNSGTSAGTNFIGTTDAQDLVVKTNGQSRLIVPSVGIASSTSSTDSVLVTKTDGYTLGKIAKTSLYPTWQQTLTAGSTLTGFNTINGGGYDFQWDNIDNYYINSAGSFGSTVTTGGKSSTIGNSGSVLTLTAQSSLGSSLINIYHDTIQINPLLGRLYIDTLNAQSNASDSMMVWAAAGANRGKVGYRAIPSAGSTPVGNYGNVQINRNSLLATPASDSLNFASGVLVTKGNAQINTLSIGLGGGNQSTNTALGYQNLGANTTGVNNTSAGYQALVNNTTGNQNTAFGQGSLYTDTTGFNNTSIGAMAMYNNGTGAANNAVGVQSLYFNTTGNYNVGEGASSLYKNTTGVSNTGIGFSSIYNNTTGYNNVGVGSATLYSEKVGHNNTALGTNALYNDTSGVNNIALGSEAGYYNTAGTGQLFINSLNRTDYTGDTTNSIIYGLQNNTNTLQRLKLNSQVYIPKDAVPITTGKKWKLMIDTATNQIVRDSTSSGGGSTNTGVGSGFQVAINGTNNIKSLTAGYGLIADSATSNQVNYKVDSATINTAMRSYVSGSYLPLVGAAYTTTTGDGLALTSSTVTTGNLMKLTNTGTVATSNTKNVLAIVSSGANATSSQTVTGQTISVTNTGTTNTNVGLNVIASGASTNYAALFTGLVGMGTATPNGALHVKGTGATSATNALEVTNSANTLLFEVENDGTTLVGRNGITYVYNDIASNNANFRLVSSSGKAIFGGLAPDSVLTVTGAAHISTNAKIDNNATIGGTLAVTGATTIRNTTTLKSFSVGGTTEKMYIDSLGGVTSVTDSITGNAIANSSPIHGNGTWFTGGSTTTTKPYLLIEPTGTTSANWPTGGTGLGVNAPSGFTGNIINAQLNGSDRFRIGSNGDLYAGNNTMTSASILSSSGYFGVTSKSYIRSTTDGYWTMYNNATTDFTALQLGGTTSSFPAIVHNGTGIDIKLADNSAYTNLAALNLTANGTLAVTGATTMTSFAAAITSSAVDIAVTASHHTILLTATGKTATLPTAIGITGRIYTIKLTASGTGTIATTSSQTIDGSTTFSLGTIYKYCTVQSDGANWNVIGNN